MKKAAAFLAVFYLGPAWVYAQTTDQYLRQGNDAFSQRAFDKAIVAYTHAIDINPNMEKAYDNRGAAYAEEGSLDRAVDDFTMAIAVNPKDLQAYHNRKMAYYQLKEYDKAWADVFMIERLGGKIDPDFYQSLKKAGK